MINKFHIGDIVQISDTSEFRSQGRDEEENKVLGKIVAYADFCNYEYNVDWENDDITYSYNFRDLVLIQPSIFTMLEEYYGD